MAFRARQIVKVLLIGVLLFLSQLLILRSPVVLTENGVVEQLAPVETNNVVEAKAGQTERPQTWVDPADAAPYRVTLHVFAECCRNKVPWTMLETAYYRLPAQVRPPISLVLHGFTKNCEVDLPRMIPQTSGASASWVGRPVTTTCHPPVWSDPAARRAAVLNISTQASTTDSVPELVMILEDVTSVAWSTFLWVDYAARMYLVAQPTSDVLLVGASLYAPRYNEVRDQPFSGPPNPLLALPAHTQLPYLLQMPPAWGGLYTAVSWHAFRQWCDTSGMPIAPAVKGLYLSDAYTNRWPVEMSWRKWMLRFLAESGGTLLYPPHEWSFVTPFDKAQPYGHPPNANEPADRSLFQTPEVKDDRIGVSVFDPAGPEPSSRPWISGLPFPPVDILDLRALNAYHDVQPSARPGDMRLNVAAAEGCTLIIAVYSRWRSLPDRLAHLAQSTTRLKKILVIWNNMDVDPSELQLPSYTVPVIVKKQIRNSMHNRMVPQPEIDTDCVMMMDDDFDMPHDVVDQVARLWHSQFFDRLVGVLGRVHNWNGTIVNDAAEGGYVYNFTSWTKPSIVLPSGMVFHRKYMYDYKALPRALLDIIDEVINCEDLLFNVMMSNLTSAAPVSLSASVMPVEKLSNQGMYSRPSHYSTRSWCLNRFAEAFPRKRLPLMCSSPLPRKFLKPGSLYITPSRAEVKSERCDGVPY